jgi:CopG family nickel-responsive transcriptional regulator
MPSRGSGVVRLGVSLEPELLQKLDSWVRARNSPSRSDALRSLIRKELVEEDLDDPESDAVATVTLLYRHDAPSVLRRLTAEEHRWGEHIRFTGHAHLEGHACVEIVVVAGRRREVVAAAEDLRGVRGVAFGDYSLASPRVTGGTTGHRHPHTRRWPRCCRLRFVRSVSRRRRSER